MIAVSAACTHTMRLSAVSDHDVLTWLQVVCDAAMVTQEVSLVVAVSAAFTHAMRLSAVSNHDVLTCQLTAANVALLLGGWICRSLIGCDPRPNKAKASARLATPPKAIMVCPNMLNCKLASQAGM